MKIVMTLLVRNEEDILEENLLFHRKMGVDFFIVMDHMSHDLTSKILKYYESFGWLKIIKQSENTYNQGMWVSQMAQEAYTAYGADWVINNDADEFWMPKEGTLKEFLEKQSPELGKIHVNRLDFHYRNFKEAKFYEALLFREWQCRWTKCCHRGVPNIAVDIGNHNAHSQDLKEKFPKDIRLSDEIRILHYPIRNYEKYKNKMQGGAVFILNTPGLSEHTGFHWKHALQQINDGTFEKEFASSKQYSAEKLVEGIKSGDIVFDDALQRFFL